MTLEIKDVDEQGNPIKDIDWTKWRRVKTEEVYDNDGNLSHILSHCVAIPQEEIDAKEQAEADAKREVLENTQLKAMARITIPAMAPTMTDIQALSVSCFFPAWAVGETYEVGYIVEYNGDLYRSLQTYPSAAEHTPDIAVALWKKIQDQTPGEVPQWEQPLGYSDAYNMGDKVKHKDKIWISTVDQNTWEPGVYGWEEVGS